MVSAHKYNTCLTDFKNICSCIKDFINKYLRVILCTITEPEFYTLKTKMVSTRTKGKIAVCYTSASKEEIRLVTKMKPK